MYDGFLSSTDLLTLPFVFLVFLVKLQNKQIYHWKEEISRNLMIMLSTAVNQDLRSEIPDISKNFKKIINFFSTEFLFLESTVNFQHVWHI